MRTIKKHTSSTQCPWTREIVTRCIAEAAGFDIIFPPEPNWTALIKSQYHLGPYSTVLGMVSEEFFDAAFEEEREELTAADLEKWLYMCSKTMMKAVCDIWTLRFSAKHGSDPQKAVSIARKSSINRLNHELETSNLLAVDTSHIINREDIETISKPAAEAVTAHLQTINEAPYRKRIKLRMLA